MNELKVNVFHIFVNKLYQRIGKILTKDAIFRLWELSGGSRSRLTYAISQAKYKWILSALSRDIYVVGEDIQDLDRVYWESVEQLIELHAPSGAIVAGEKSMEYHLQNYSIPEVLILYTSSLSKRIRLWDGREVHFRSLQAWEKKWYKNLFRILQKHSQKWIFSSAQIDILSLEWAILDTWSIKTHGIGLPEELIEKFVRKYEKKLSRESLWELVSYRYIRSANRLRAFARDRGFTLLYQHLLEVIKREGGGCFLNI